jgi:ABC-type transport system substrate-binding protein
MTDSSRVLRVGVLTPVEGLDPRQEQEHVSVLVMRQVFEAPFEGGAPPRPSLFSGPLERSRSGNGVRYRGRLRPDARFSDGTPVDALGVAECLAAVETLRGMVRIGSEGPQVVTFDADRELPRLETTLALRWCCVVREVEGTCLGTGPYQIATPVGAETVRLVRNSHYPRTPEIEEIHFTVYPPDDSGCPGDLIAAVEAGEVDFTTMLSRDDVGRITNARKLFRPGLSVALLFLNCESAWLDRSEARRAVALGLDRRALAARSFHNAGAFIARSLLPPSMTELRPRVAYDPSAAAQMVASLGGGPKSPLRMLVIWAPRPYLPHPTRYAETIVEQLGALGVEVEAVREDSAQGYFNRVRRGDYDLCLCGWMADTPDPVDFVEALLGSDMIPSPDRSGVVAANLGRWADSEMDTLLAAFRSQPSDERAAPILERVAEQVPVIPLSYGATTFVHGWHVTGFDPDRDLEPDLSRLAFRDR